MSKTRCQWLDESQPIYVEYHDHEWGVPVFDDQKLFEFLILEGAQAGLSWITVLKKREGYRNAFDQFDMEKIAAYDEAKIQSIKQDPGVIRNELKIRAAVTNAQMTLKLLEHQSLSDYFWSFVDGKPIINHWKSIREVPATTSLSDQISKDLKKKGFKFIGSTIIYAHMQAMGMVNDHTTDCFRHRELS